MQSSFFSPFHRIGDGIPLPDAPIEGAAAPSKGMGFLTSGHSGPVGDIVPTAHSRHRPRPRLSEASWENHLFKSASMKPITHDGGAQEQVFAGSSGFFMSAMFSEQRQRLHRDPQQNAPFTPFVHRQHMHSSGMSSTGSSSVGYTSHNQSEEGSRPLSVDPETLPPAVGMQPKCCPAIRSSRLAQAYGDVLETGRSSLLSSHDAAEGTCWILSIREAGKPHFDAEVMFPFGFPFEAPKLVDFTNVSASHPTNQPFSTGVEWNPTQAFLPWLHCQVEQATQRSHQSPFVSLWAKEHGGHATHDHLLPARFRSGSTACTNDANIIIDAASYGSHRHQGPSMVPLPYRPAPFHHAQELTAPGAAFG